MTEAHLSESLSSGPGALGKGQDGKWFGATGFLISADGSQTCLHVPRTSSPWSPFRKGRSLVVEGVLAMDARTTWRSKLKGDAAFCLWPREELKVGRRVGW